MKMIFNCSKSPSKTVSGRNDSCAQDTEKLQDNKKKGKKREGNPNGPVIDVWKKKAALSGISELHSVPNAPVGQAQQDINMWFPKN